MTAVHADDLLWEPFLRAAVSWVLPPPPDWQQQALCAGDDINVYIPEKATLKTIAEAKRVCGMCPVRGKCLQWAIDNDEHGVWGGTTLKERQAMTRQTVAA